MTGAKIFALKGIALAGAILMAAAATQAQEAQQPPVPHEPPVAAAPPKPADNSGQAPQTQPPMKWKEFNYTCEGGTKLVVFLRGQSVKVRYKEKAYLMHQVPSGSGVRYSDGKVQWWSKGNGGFLQEDTPDGNGAMIVKDCNLDKPMGSENNEGANGSQASAMVSGTVTYMVRSALPPTAVIVVVLLDVTGSNDAVAGTLVAEKKLTLGDRQVPVEFHLGYDKAKINPEHSYGVSARILVDGTARFASDKPVAVVTQGNPSHVEVMVKPVKAG
jgi:putative lipoprotein